jgi:primary-amine oxidase
VQILNGEWFGDAEAIKADPGLQAALRGRSIADIETVRIEPWSVGNFRTDLDRSGRRLGRSVAHVVDNSGDNPYARPVENLVAVVDRDSGAVVGVHDGDVVVVPTDLVGTTWTPAERLCELAPLEISQPRGAGFTVDDGRVVGSVARADLHEPPEGLVLHDVRWEGGAAVPAGALPGEREGRLQRR